MKKILIISFSNIAGDPRVMRQIRLLAPLSKLTIAGFGYKPDVKADFLELKQRNRLLDKVSRAIQLFLGFYHHYYWSQAHIKKCISNIKSFHFDLIIANDLSALPLALRLAKGAKVLFDAHEYSPMEAEEKILWRLTHGKLNKYLCKNYLCMTDGMLTVSDGISDEYLRQYGISSKVVYNAPNYQNIVPKKTEKKFIRLIHHGASIKSRHLETMIKMMDYLDERYSLDLMLTETNSSYLKKLKKLASRNPKIKFVQSVPMEAISHVINSYDIGVYILSPTNFNHMHALPNKFFEFIQARLAIAIGPSLDMKKLIDKYKIGVVANSFEARDLAQELNKLNSADIDQIKKASDKVAFELSADSECKKILESVESLIGSL